MPVWMVPNEHCPGFISLFRHMLPALSNHACNCSMPCLLHWTLSLSSLTPRMHTSSRLLLLSHTSLRLMMSTTAGIVNNLVMILIHARMLFWCIGFSISGLQPMNRTCTEALLMARLCSFAIKWMTLPLPPGPVLLLTS